MFNSQILDAAIGLVVVYFFLSLLCSVIAEIFTSLTKKRARMLRDGILSLLQDPKALDKLYEQPLFMGNSSPKGFWQGLFESIKPFWKKRFPSYISSRSFVLSLLESLKQHPDVVEKLKQLKLDIPSIDSVDHISTLVQCLPDNNTIRKALLPLLETAGTAADSLDKAIKNMEKWYDEAMERVSGWYKRYSQAFALVLAFLVALVLNADTFQIGKAIYRDQVLRASLISTAEQTIKQQPPPSGQKKPEEGNQGPQSNDSEAPGLKKQVEKANEVFQQISSLNLPIGWPLKASNEKSCWAKLGFRRQPDTANLGLVKLLGILLTALMVSLGSNFWFELLSKFMNIRNAGKKPLTREEQDAQKK
ncbi:MAG TPA: hypothetical protein VKF36_04750 [Syntrophorhabdales bacterium]|nr:hypothetical protein [Syntrophorhabdales bacterium]